MGEHSTISMHLFYVLLNNTTRAKGSGSVYVADGGGGWRGGDGACVIFYCILLSSFYNRSNRNFANWQNFELRWKQSLQSIPVYQLLSYCSRIDSKVILQHHVHLTICYSPKNF